MRLIIGCKFYWHDSAVFIYNIDTKECFAISTERLTRYKHDSIFPMEAIQKYIDYCKIDAKSVTQITVAHSFSSFEFFKISKYDYLKETLLRKVVGAKYLKEYLNGKKNIPFSKKLSYDYLQYKFYKIFDSKTTVGALAKEYIAKMFPNADIKSEYYDHQFTHAISAFVASRYESAVCVSMDGQGDGCNFSSVYKFESDFSYKLLASSNSNIRDIVFKYADEMFCAGCSIGGIYSYFTYFLGFTPNADEGKVEALAAFGKPIKDLSDILNLAFKVNGSQITVDENILTNKLALKIIREDYLQNHSKEDMSATIQNFSEKLILEYIKNVLEAANCSNLCLSGGVFANVIINKKIYEQLTPNIYIIPAMSDDGTSEGACYASMLNNALLQDLKSIRYEMPYFGTSYDKNTVAATLDLNSSHINYKLLQEEWQPIIAKMVADGKIGALFLGKMEWGPRALGNRSIIARVNDKDIQKKINGEIKRRPNFQPFCPSILIEEKDRLFEKSYNNKHMTIAFTMKNEHIANIPSAVHIDATARVQFVNKEDNLGYWTLINEVKKLTGYGVIINTSFNKHGRTIVESAQDAIDDFLDTDMDYLFIEGYLVTRK